VRRFDEFAQVGQHPFLLGLDRVPAGLAGVRQFGVRVDEPAATGVLGGHPRGQRIEDEQRPPRRSGARAALDDGTHVLAPAFVTLRQVQRDQRLLCGPVHWAPDSC
jgi:hypothetical protein